MADVSGLQRQPLGQVILPASHDSASYALRSGRTNGPDPAQYTVAQDIDVYTQLQDGIRVLDLRGTKVTWDGVEDYYVSRDKDTSDLPLSTVLDDVGRWVVAPGHDKEVVIVQVAAKRTDEASSTDLPAPRFDAMCGRFKQNLGGLMLTAASFGEAVALSAQLQQTALTTNPMASPPPLLQFEHLGNSDLATYTLQEVWKLPGKQRVIVKWDDCVGTWPAGTWNGYWANQCYAGEYSAVAKLAWGADPRNMFKPAPDPITFTRPGIIGAIRDALNGRLQNDGSDGQYGGLGAIATKPTTFVNGPIRNKVPVGFYTLGTHATITPECGYPTDWFLNEQAAAQEAVKGWFDTDQNNARNYLNIVSGDFVERPVPGKPTLVDYAIQMNKPAAD